MKRGRREVYIIILLMLTARPAAAQSSSGAFVGVRAGANVIGNTYRLRESKPIIGGGASVGTSLSPYWALELEAWVRSANPECCTPRHRETLYSLSVVRLLATAGLQPYMLGGLTLLRSSGNQMQVQVGVGAQFPVFRNIAMAIDLRGNGGGSTMIVRPTVAGIYYFH